MQMTLYFSCGIFDPWDLGVLESRILVENGSEMTENGAGEVSRRSVQAVAPSSLSLRPWRGMGTLCMLICVKSKMMEAERFQARGFRTLDPGS